MADAYCDSQAANDTGNGLTWATAKLTIEAADVVTGAGGRVFAQDSVSGGFIETQSSTKSYSFSGTKFAPQKFYACKSGTTNEPPVSADLVDDKDDSDIAKLEVTGASQNLTMPSFCYFWGFKVGTDSTARDTTHVGDNTYEECILICGRRLILNGLWTLNSNIELINLGSELRFGSGFVFISGGLLVAPSGVNIFAAPQNNARAILSGFDLSAAGAIGGLNMSLASGGLTSLWNCKIPASWVIIDTVGNRRDNQVKMVGCDSSADHTDTIRQYRDEPISGRILDDTPFISGGAQDRGSGDGYSFSMNLNDNAVVERFWPLYTEWLEVPLDGTETTLTIEFMRKDTGAPADLDNETCWVELQSPNEGVGSATSQYAFQTSRVADPVASAAALTSSSVTWSSLGGETAKKQKVVLTISPEYAGVARYRVAYAERGSSILPLYFDPFPTLA